MSGEKILLIFLIISLCIIVFSILIIFVFLKLRSIKVKEFVYYLIAKFNKNPKKTYIKLISKYPNSYLGHKMLAKLYEDESNIENAISEYIKLSDIKRDNLEIKYKIACLLNSINKQNDAKEILSDIVKIKPENFDATCLLGDILYKEQNYKEAVNLYISALKYNPGNYDLYYNLGMTYIMLNDFGNAKLCYQKASEINHLIYNSKYTLAQIAMLYCEIEEAETYFYECLNDEKFESGSYYYLAKICMFKSKKEDAINYLNLAIELDYRLYKKAHEETVFIPIKKYIKYVEEQQIKTNLIENEEEVFQHLDKMSEIVGKLSYGDYIIKNRKNKAQDIIKEKEKDQEKQ